MVLALPLGLAHITIGIASKFGYFRSFTWFGMFLFVLFLGIAIYMVKTSIWLGQDAEPYRIVPSEG
jgi:hypothetical protein